MTARGVRRLQSWIQSFIEFSEASYTPLIFRRWAAISIIAGALERKVWVHTRNSDLYPNLYILLVGPPGTGKGLTMNEVNRFWGALEGYHLSPISVTKASLIDALNSAQRKILNPERDPAFLEYNSLLAAVPEFSDFAPLYEPSLMSALQSVYDGVPTSEKRRGKNLDIKIQSPQLNLIAGTTPSYLNSFIPEGAWDQGFISRTIMIFSGEESSINLFASTSSNEALHLDLTHDLNVIANLVGKLSWSAEAAEAIQSWINSGREPVPEHRRLLHYATRRIAHVIKLCIVFSIERSNAMRIEIEDFHSALNVLVEAETQMPEIFKSVSGGGESAAIEDAYHFVWQIYTRKKEPVLEHKLVAFLSERVPVHAVMRVIEIMVRSRVIELVDSKGAGLNTYRPIPRIHKE